jgi:imidazoleglycerol phosphate synthase glutamine amidotransferase subunit HisH
MMDNIDKFIDTRLRALERTEKDKSQVVKTYNKKVKEKSFQVNNLVWKTILSLGIKSTPSLFKVVRHSSFFFVHGFCYSTPRYFCMLYLDV